MAMGAICPSFCSSVPYSLSHRGTDQPLLPSACRQANRSGSTGRTLPAGRRAPGLRTTAGQRVADQSRTFIRNASRLIAFPPMLKYHVRKIPRTNNPTQCSPSMAKLPIYCGINLERLTGCTTLKCLLTVNHYGNQRTARLGAQTRRDRDAGPRYCDR
jgi:hypothetical protein